MKMPLRNFNSTLSHELTLQVGILYILFEDQ